MKLRDPRVQKTAQVVMLVAFGFWLDGLDARATYDMRYWLLLVTYLIGIVGSAYLILRDVWKPMA